MDGFNFYRGLCADNLHDCRWLDWSAYGNILAQDGEVVQVHYFTALVNTPVDSRGRQERYLRALRAHGGLHITEGDFKSRDMKCAKVECGHTWKRPKERFTDVNIAIAMVHDCLHGATDRMLVMSGDSDLIPAVQYVQRRGMEVVNVIPPKRKSDDLVQICDDALHVDPVTLRRCQLLNPVMESFRGGRKTRPIHAPDGWTTEPAG